MVIKPSILSQEPMSNLEVHDALKKLQKERGELNYRANKTFEFLKQLSLNKKKEEKELYDKIMALDIPRVKDMHVKKILDLMPSTEQELDVIFYGGTISINKESKKKIINALKG